jgi:hypothetical protein
LSKVQEASTMAMTFLMPTNTQSLSDCYADVMQCCEYPALLREQT